MTAAFLANDGLRHLAVLPILLPLVAGALQLLLPAARALAWQRAIAFTATLALLPVCAWLVAQTSAGHYLAYAVGDWAAPFGIFLMVDRLSAWLLLLTAVIAPCALLYALAGEEQEGPSFHALFQFQLVGINGAFLTADLFNLFVFFEVLLIASYALLMHGQGAARTRAAVHLVVLNLVGSLLFLIAIACIYASLGTLNMADLAMRAARVRPENAALLNAGGWLLLIVFALKAALLPLGFWLPRSYGAATAAVAALFALLTKVGAYAILRVYTLIFSGTDGPASAVLPIALLTVILGSLGAMAAVRLRLLAPQLLLVSMGTLLTAIGLFTPLGIAASVYYLAHSTLASALLLLVADLVSRQRGAADDRLDIPQAAAQPVPLAVYFAVAAIAITGLPPFAGFPGKLAILAATSDLRVWLVLLATTLLGIVTLARAGSAVFWRTAGTHAPAVRAPRAAFCSIGLLAAAGILLLLCAAPAFRYAEATAAQLFDRAAYVDATFAVRSQSAPLLPRSVPAGTLAADPGDSP